jgi:hypothetical protein
MAFAGQRSSMQEGGMKGIVLVAVLFVCVCAVCACGTKATAVTSATTHDASLTADASVSGDNPALIDPDAAVASAIRLIETVLELEPGSVTESSGETGLSPGDVMLGWNDGHAEVDPISGRIVMILFSNNTAHPKAAPSVSELDRAATQYVEQLGWDSKSLTADGFTTTETTTYDRGDAPTEFTKRWTGHDENDVANGGLIEVALDAATGKLLRFFYHLGPRVAVETTTITEEEAVAIARETVGENPPADPTTTESPVGGATTTRPSLGLVLQSAELVHSDAPGITGGKDMLIWIVKLGGYTQSGYAHPTIYIDAVAGEVLQELY